MGVFRCMSCGRLLYRPEKMPGQDWHCYTCGPTTVSEDAVSVSAELAALLEKEYWLDLADFQAQLNSSEPPAVISPGRPGGTRLPRRGQLKQDDPKVVAVLLVGALAVLVLAVGVFTSLSDKETVLHKIIVFAFGCFALAAVGLLVLGVKEVSRRRWLKRADEPRNAPASGTTSGAPDSRGSPAEAEQHVQRPDDPITPGPTGDER
jgi:hypothetical protein